MDGSSQGGGRDHEIRPGKPDTLIRVRPGPEGLEVGREAALLDVLRQRTSMPIPRVLRLWRSRQAMEQSRIPGRSLLGLLPQLTEPQAVRLGGELGEFIVDLARVPRLAVAHLVENSPLSLRTCSPTPWLPTIG